MPEQSASGGPVASEPVAGSPRRRRRRAVGPAGSRPVGPEPRAEPDPESVDGSPDAGECADDDRLRADRPPHHDRDR